MDRTTEYNRPEESRRTESQGHLEVERNTSMVEINPEIRLSRRMLSESMKQLPTGDDKVKGRDTAPSLEDTSESSGSADSLAGGKDPVSCTISSIGPRRISSLILDKKKEAPRSSFTTTLRSKPSLLSHQSSSALSKNAPDAPSRAQSAPVGVGGKTPPPGITSRQSSITSNPPDTPTRAQTMGVGGRDLSPSYRTRVSAFWQNEFTRISQTGKDLVREDEDAPSSRLGGTSVPEKVKADKGASTPDEIENQEAALLQQKKPPPAGAIGEARIKQDAAGLRRPPNGVGVTYEKRPPRVKSQDATDLEALPSSPLLRRAQSTPVPGDEVGSKTPPSYRRQRTSYWEEEFRRRSIGEKDILPVLDLLEEDSIGDESEAIENAAWEVAAKSDDEGGTLPPPACAEEALKARERADAAGTTRNASARPSRRQHTSRQDQERVKAYALMEAAALIEMDETPPATMTIARTRTGSPVSRVDAAGVVRTFSVIGGNEVVEPVMTSTLTEYSANNTQPPEGGLDNSATFLPGAYAARGPHFHGSTSQNEDEQLSVAGEESEEYQEYNIPLRENESTGCPEAMEAGVFRASVVSAESTEVSASLVNDAETIFEAKDVRKDNCLRNIILSVLGGVVCCVLIVTLGLVFSGRNKMVDYTGDPLCEPPVEQQSIAVRCYCSNSTGGLLRSMSEDQQYAYMRQLMFLQRHGIVPEDIEIDEDGCDPLNQDLLIAANMTSQMETAAELFNRGSDEFRLTMATFIRMYTSMGGLHWAKSTNWLDSEVCVWDGVTCLFVDVVYKFLLTENHVSGRLPAAFIGTLDSLRTLDLSMNGDIVGTIPTEIAGMRSLQSLIFSHTSLSGSIPSEIARLDRLDTLVLNRNKLTGTIPATITKLNSTLRSLELSSNMFSGTVPPELGKLSRLTGLLLGGNKFTGSLPAEMAQLSNLELLSVGKNQFEGTIPDFLGTMPRLEMIYLYQSGLVGAVPETFCANSTIPRRMVVMCETTELCSCCSTTDPNAMVRLDCYEDMQPGDASWLDL